MRMSQRMGIGLDRSLSFRCAGLAWVGATCALLHARGQMVRGLASNSNLIVITKAAIAQAVRRAGHAAVDQQVHNPRPPRGAGRRRACGPAPGTRHRVEAWLYP